MQSYFGTLTDNGNLDLLDESHGLGENGRTLDISGSLGQIGLQTSTGHGNIQQDDISLHTQNELSDDDDLFVCGRCKQQFTDLQLFVTHKRDGCVSIRQQHLNYQNDALFQQLQVNGQLQQNAHALPGATVVFAQNQGLVTPGQQPHSIMISAAPCSEHSMNDPNGLNMAQDGQKEGTLSSNALNNINLLTCDSNNSQITINQVGNLVQIQGTPFHNVGNAIAIQGNVGPDNLHNQGENIVLSEEMLLNAEQPPNQYVTDQMSRAQNSNGHAQQFVNVTEQVGNENCIGMSSFLQQIPPLQPQGQVLIQLPQNNESMQEKDILNGINFSTVNVASLAVNASNTGFIVKDDQTSNAIAQNLAKLPTIAPLVKNVVLTTEQNTVHVNTVFSSSANSGMDGPGKSKKKYVCNYCSKAFSRAFDLEQHIRSHTGEKPFQCIVCGRAFSQKSNVKKHMATHKIWPKKVTDELPNIVVVQDTKESAGNHKGTTEQEEPQGGGTSMENPEEVPAFQDTLAIMNKSIHTCPYCYKIMSSYKERKIHMTEHKDQQVYKCVKENCEETFPDMDSFIKHVKSHDGELTYRCHHCHEIFASLDEVGIHQYQDHLNDISTHKGKKQSYSCENCPKKFPNQELLDKHMSSESHNHPCTICPKRFSCKLYLTKHLVLMHSEKRKEGVKCDVCGAKMKSKYYLRSHMLIHTNEKPFKCDVCPSAFNRKDKLRRHMLLHDPVKKWKCPLRDVLGCNKEFNRPDKLKAHIIVHGGVRNHKCSYCPKAFTRRCYKIAHERSHTGEFRCGNCTKCFPSAQKLSNHRTKSCETITSNLISKRTRGASSQSSTHGPSSSDRSGARKKMARAKSYRKSLANASKRREKSRTSRKLQDPKIHIEITEDSNLLNKGENITLTLNESDTEVNIEDNSE